MLDRELGRAIYRPCTARRWLPPSTRCAHEASRGVGLLHPRHGSYASFRTQGIHLLCFVIRIRMQVQVFYWLLTSLAVVHDQTGRGRAVKLVAWISEMLHGICSAPLVGSGRIWHLQQQV
ncbi:unnamed protein product [Urochloa humidicola]